jgi:hypothetical protein
LEPQPHIGWGEIEIKANSAQLELELGLSLAIELLLTTFGGLKFENANCHFELLSWFILQGVPKYCTHFV